MSTEWIDISVPLKTGLAHWPGDPDVQIQRFLHIDQDGCNASKIAMSAHTGTHVDARRHFVPDGEGVEQLPLDGLIGPVRVIAIEHPQRVTADELLGHNLQAGERVLFRTRNSQRPGIYQGDFVTDFVALDQTAARHLVERQVQTVGIDYLSIGLYEGDGVLTHQILLGARVCILEGLDLSKVLPGKYELVCLPLLLAGADGAPARAVLRPL